jgi:hypothetical protein
MSIDKLIALSDFGFWETWWAGAFQPYTIVAVVFMVFFGLLFTEHIVGAIFFGVLVSLSVGWFLGEPILLDEFKEENLKPYISNLEYKKVPIDDISFLEKNLSNTTYFTEEELDGKKLVSVLITYSEKGEINPIKTNALIKTDVEDIEDIYMEYKTLTKDIPNIVTKGSVNYVVHIPEDFFKKKLLLKETGSTE